MTGVHPDKEGEVGNMDFRPWASPAVKHAQGNIQALLLCYSSLGLLRQDLCRQAVAEQTSLSC